MLFISFLIPLVTCSSTAEDLGHKMTEKYVPPQGKPI